MILKMFLYPYGDKIEYDEPTTLDETIRKGEHFMNSTRMKLNILRDGKRKINKKWGNVKKDSNHLNIGINQRVIRETTIVK